MARALGVGGEQIAVVLSRKVFAPNFGVDGRFVEFDQLPIEWTEYRLLVRQVTDILRRHEALDPGQATRIHDLGRGPELPALVRRWYDTAPGAPPEVKAAASDVEMLDDVLALAARPFLTRTAELANVVRKALGYRQGQKSDPATRTFQAIRIHLNAELDELEQGLRAAERALKPGGRIAVVTFHSLEDRIVKRFLKERSGNVPAGSRHRPQIARGPAPTFEKVARPVAPSERELARNPRARSARLRTAVRTDAPAWDQGGHA